MHRKSRSLTLKELSCRIGVTPSFISDIENGKKTPSLETLGKLSEALGIPLFEFFKGNSSTKGGESSAPPANTLAQDNFMLQARALFMSSNLTNEDKEAIFRDISDLYWKAKGLK
ncbi:MAG: helix-turn-helix domain-containing protein [Caulobacteraceae bacterium]